ncbi:MAG: ATP-dependent helicase HrpB [Acidimicrobiia bacterium]
MVGTDDPDPRRPRTLPRLAGTRLSVAALPDLPVSDSIPAIRDALASARRAVLVAPPGAGKTTIVPLALLDEEWLAGRAIVMLEPRRLATRAAARRMAHLLGEEVGQTVGYQTRDERRIGRDTRLEVVTEGVLTRRLQHDASLPAVGMIVFDEVHERNLPTDLGLALTLDVAANLRPDLRVLAKSATPDTERLAAVLGGAPVIASTGRQFDVDIRWVPRGRDTRLEPAMVSVVQRALVEESGDVLAFLPGIGEINRTLTSLRDVVGSSIDVYPLAGALTLAEQDAALAASPTGRRRVVLTTDIAETSLTVEGVSIVVDSGLARAPRFDVRTGMTRLTTVSTSRASAEQRAGRAGRTGPGACYRLWSKLEHGTRQPHRAAEITEVDLAGLALELAAWHAEPDQLRFIDRPPAKAFAAARALLGDLGALDDRGELTDVGRQMLGLPVHPRLARMIAVSPTPLACVLAALVDERAVLRGRLDDLPADIAIRVRVIADTGFHDQADRGAVERLRDRAADIAKRSGIGFGRGELREIDPDDAGATLLLAFPDRLAGRRRAGQFQLRTGSGAWLPDNDPLATEEFVVAADLDGKRDRARIRLGAAIDAEDVAAVFADELDETRTLTWVSSRDDLVENVERRLGSIRLGIQSRPPSPGDATVAALVQRVRATQLAVLGWTAASIRLRERVEFLHRTIGEPWPDWSVATLVRTLDSWLAPYLTGATGRRDLEALDVATVLRSQLPWSVGGELDRIAPPRLELPSGRAVPIDYSADTPRASVRVQEMFGVREHPAAGNTPIVLTLLSPADRPIQVTSDLPGFWAGTWNEVRKEMAGRYPKHHWPTDPATASPKHPGQR